MGQDTSPNRAAIPLDAIQVHKVATSRHFAFVRIASQGPDSMDSEHLFTRNNGCDKHHYYLPLSEL